MEQADILLNKYTLCLNYHNSCKNIHVHVDLTEGEAGGRQQECICPHICLWKKQQTP